MQKIESWIKTHENKTLFVLVLIFILIRLPAAGFPLHQDEYKWPIAVNPAQSAVIIPHPPLGEFIYRVGGYIVGFNVNFRFVPLFFGVLNLSLFYYFMRFVFGRREAIIGSLIWIFSYFSVLASLMVDTDGEIMPFFFLIALIGYFKNKESAGNNRWKWPTLLLVGCLGGLLVKVSFVLAVGAILADFLWSKKDILHKNDILRYIVRLGIGLIGFVIVLILSQKLFPFFDLHRSLTYWEHFFTWNRDWFQTAIQCVKAVLYASPLLVLVPLFDVRLVWEKTKVFVFFLMFAFIFYVVLFDFSLGALDRYLQLLILPLTVMSATVISRAFQTEKTENETPLYLGNSYVHRSFLGREGLIGVLASLALIALQFKNHFVPSLHPKSEWIARIISLDWNFLFPFSGGSGPLGFYVSFLSMAFAWILSAGFLVLSFYKPRYKKAALCIVILLGIAYNGIFMEEYLFGFVNGSAPRLLTGVVEHIKNDPDIQRVAVYNDNGGAEVQATGKYWRRIYVAPQFDSGFYDIFRQFQGHILFIDIPRVNPESAFARYIEHCPSIYSQKDGYITAQILDCTRTSGWH